MKNVRLIYRKNGPLKFVSHLDMNRFMTRLIRLSKVPVWYTEGFNKHPYITFALPLSLGFTSDWEIMDFRFDDDAFSLSKAKEMISAVCPKGLEVIDLVEPTFKPGKIALADFEITFNENSALTKESLEEFLNRDSIVVSKKTKKGGIKEIDIKPKLDIRGVEVKENRLCLSVRLPAGGGENINPKFVADEYLCSLNQGDCFYTVNRTGLYLEEGTLFK